MAGEADVFMTLVPNYRSNFSGSETCPPTIRLSGPVGWPNSADIGIQPARKLLEEKACCAPGHHGYHRACVLISGQASSGAIWVTRVRMRPEDRSSISSNPLKAGALPPLEGARKKSAAEAALVVQTYVSLFFHIDNDIGIEFGADRKRR